jgi:acyl-CoA reductase-like NAD-dependent aldehyde dehydrogenase
MGDHHVFVDEF